VIEVFALRRHLGRNKFKLQTRDWMQLKNSCQHAEDSDEPTDLPSSKEDAPKKQRRSDLARNIEGEDAQ